MKPETLADLIQERDTHIAHSDIHIAQAKEHQRKAELLNAVINGEESQSHPRSVLMFLSEHPQYHTPAEISEAIAKQKGMENTRNFYASIFMTCKRLLADGKILMAEKNGGKAFAIK